jgi:hypothetical protein
MDTYKPSWIVQEGAKVYQMSDYGHIERRSLYELLVQKKREAKASWTDKNRMQKFQSEQNKRALRECNITPPPPKKG